MKWFIVYYQDRETDSGSVKVHKETVSDLVRWFAQSYPGYTIEKIFVEI